MNRLLPCVGDELLLAVPHTEHVLVRVASDGPGFFDLALLEQPLTPQPQLERSALMIEFINDDGIARMHGRLDVPQHRRGRGSGYGHEDTVRFAHRGSPQLLKRREFVRATVELPLTVGGAEADEEGVTAHAQALDLSGGGMLVRGLPNPVLGDEHDFALELADGEPIRGRGRVVRIVGIDRAGLQFTDVEQEDRVRLMHVAFAMSRDQRRRFG
ncbi:MAG TPA: PilZ domain-containing protein [Baekduia sp.]|uniref:PilZ domain-containing protein n=1 Tax=Baekduia sp. TaxID=2600305 RepID=UPI002B6B6623|nr:PilZ domain-containing protein [Baekduia sp.]HMJ33109.1 PilZ domain-containing protein [Baekduia sp.]